jgi:hypothetical protein
MSASNDPNVLYSDEYVTIVREGGIEVYTAVGYMDVGIDFEGAKRVCQEGLKTFRHMYDKQLNYSTPANIKKARNNLLENRHKGRRNILNDYEVQLRKDNNVTENSYKELLFQNSLYTTSREGFYSKNSSATNHIFFRAPLTYPTTIDKSGKLVPMENLDNAILNDYYRDAQTMELMSGADGMHVDTLVSIRVDPSKTRVYSSYLRPHLFVTKENIETDIMMLDEYMEFLKSKPGYVQFEKEILVNPPSGVLDPSVFASCISYKEAKQQQLDPMRKKINDIYMKKVKDNLKMYTNREDILTKIFMKRSLERDNDIIENINRCIIILEKKIAEGKETKDKLSIYPGFIFTLKKLSTIIKQGHTYKQHIINRFLKSVMYPNTSVDITEHEQNIIEQINNIEKKSVLILKYMLVYSGYTNFIEDYSNIARSITNVGLGITKKEATPATIMDTTKQIVSDYNKIKSELTPIIGGKAGGKTRRRTTRKNKKTRRSH